MIIARQCNVCDKYYTTDAGSSYTIYCSPECRLETEIKNDFIFICEPTLLGLENYKVLARKIMRGYNEWLI